ncbi:MAG: biotin/lipoate A/B protein ligase family protein [Acidimicrobiales bacterium]
MSDSSDSQPWRYLDLGAIDAFESNAQLPVVVRDVASTGRPAVTTSVWGRTHLNVGWFDDVDETLDLNAAREKGVQVIRRPFYGGGTAFYGEGCAATWAFLLPKAGPEVTGESLDDRLARYQPLVLDFLARLGLSAVQFEGSSDLRINGRKLGALTAQDIVACDCVGGFVNLSKPDLDLYLSVARVPDEKFKDKLVKDLREYVITAEEIAGRPVGYEDFRLAVLGALDSAGIAWEPGPFTEKERERLSRGAAKVASDDWVRRISSERFRAAAPSGARVGFGNYKGRKLCRAGVALDADGVVVAAMLAGDMHVGPPDVIDRVAAALVGARADDAAELKARIASVFEGPDVHQADALMGVTTDDLLAAVHRAVEAAGA